MLRSPVFGTQAPRKYPVPVNSASTLPSSAAASGSTICSQCSETIWTIDLFAKLQKLPSGEQQFVSVHDVHSSQLRDSVMQGCLFCKSLADGIHGKVFLETLYEQWNHTDSWPSNGSDGDLEEDSDAGGNDGDEARETLQLEDNHKSDSDGNDVSAFNEEFYEDDITGGWNAYEDKDTLEMPCHFHMELSFERGEDDLFTFFNVHLESTDQEEDNALVKLRGESAVDLRYHINCEGQSRFSRHVWDFDSG